MDPTTSKIPISVLIPAKNEELNLPACLMSVARADQVFLVDSQSTDRTVEIAENWGAKVVQFYFNSSWPKKKNWSLANLPFRHDWVLIVDCDERIIPELWDEIAEVIQNPDYDGYYLNRRVFFLGKWLRYGGRYPDWNLRLFKHQKGRYESLGAESVPNTGDNEVHEHVILDGRRVGYLKHDMLHEDFRDLYHWIQRHNSYSNWEARVYYNIIHNTGDDKSIEPNFFGEPVQRTRFLKKIWVLFVPAKPWIRFILIYFLRWGFLDGKAGYIYAKLMAYYEYQIAAKLYELRYCGGQLNTTKDQH
jgi:glycosyltransferase involved in cell wall biosynthesis